ncbi:MAG: UPF0104 family protein [Gemmatimonadetes bacterium]|nr:MAG: UPF0104 family protein [Gemmatimonadota bacterium]
MKPVLKLVLSLLFSGLFLYLAFQPINFQKLGVALQQVHYGGVLLAVVFTLSSYIPRALRWRYLLRSIKSIPHLRLYSPLMIGFMGNCVLPARMGEFLRAYVVGRQESISKSSAFATIVVSRLFDGLSLLFFLWLIAVVAAPDWGEIPVSIGGYHAQLPVSTLSMLFLGGYMTVVLVLVALCLWEEQTLRLIQLLLFGVPHRFKARILDLLRGFVAGLHIIKNLKDLLSISGYSLIIWVLLGISYMPLLMAIDFGTTFPFYTPFLLVAISSFGAAIPAAPGFIGTYHYFLMFALNMVAVGVDQHHVAALAIIAHAVQVLPVILIGLIFFMKEHLSFRTIRAKQMEVNP